MIVLAGVMLGRGWHELARSSRLLITASPLWIGLALGGQIGTLFLVAGKYRLLLRRLGHRIGMRTLVRCQVRRFVVTTVVPFGAAPSIYVLVRDLGDEGVPASDSIFAALLYGIIGKLTFFFVTLPLLIWFFTTTGARFHFPATGFALPAAAALLLGALAWFSREVLASLPIVRRWSPKLRHTIDSIRAHGIRPRDLAGPLALSVAVNATGALTLFSCLRAVGAHAPLSTVVAGRSVATAAGMAMPVFHGAGAIELAMTGAFHRAGATVSAALAAALLYRIAQFWLPLTLGLLVFPWKSVHPTWRPAHQPLRTASFAAAAAGLLALGVMLPQFDALALGRQATESVESLTDLTWIPITHVLSGWF